MSKTILAEVDGFTPLIDALLPEVGVIGAAVFGRMWRYCQMENGICHASLEAIAGELDISVRTVMRHSDQLVKLGYLKDLTPELRNRPHLYSDTGKAGLAIQVVGMTKSHSDNLAEYPDKLSGQGDNLSQPGMTNSHLKKEYKKAIKKESKKDGAEQTPRPRDPLFDAIAQVTHTDPATAGSSIAKVKAVLAKATPPYTPAEVIRFGAEWPAWKDKPPTLWQLKEQIGIVRQNGTGAQHEYTTGSATTGTTVEPGYTPEQRAAAERINAARAAK
jgi:DNA-binding Lrp family transcriptional regulator